MTDRKIKEDWLAFMDWLMTDDVPDATETRDEAQRRIARLEDSPEEWFTYYFPGYTFAQPAAFHISATQRILSNPEWYEVRMWSRELAKSTRTMMEVLYLCLAGKKRYVLLISNSLDNAVRLLAPYKSCLEHNARLLRDYGRQEQAGKWQAAEFTTCRGAAFRALGAGQSPRGTRNEEARPDVILFDDIDTDADCCNSETINKKWKWIEEAAIGTRSVSQPTTILFCGNRIAHDCCIVRACKLADEVNEVAIRDAAGTSSWKEKNTEEHINRVLRQKSYAAAQKEYFNNPIIEGSIFRQMAYKPALPVKEYDTLVCYTDPSYKDGAHNDYKATVLVGRKDGEFHIIKCFVAQTTTAKLIDWHYAIMDIVGESTCYYYMEEVFLQDVIIKEICDHAATHGRHIPLRGDRRRKPNKFMRIESLLEPLHRNGYLYLNERQRHSPHMMRLAEQFLAFSPQSSAHDDAPDAVEGAVWMINTKPATDGRGIEMQPRPLNLKRAS